MGPCQQPARKESAIVDSLNRRAFVKAKAVSQVAAQNKKVFFSTGTEAAELTGEEFFETTFRCCLNTDMHSAELAIYFTKLASQKYAKFYLLNQDYNFGRAAADGFKRK